MQSQIFPKLSSSVKCMEELAADAARQRADIDVFLKPSRDFRDQVSRSIQESRRLKESLESVAKWSPPSAEINMSGWRDIEAFAEDVTKSHSSLRGLITEAQVQHELIDSILGCSPRRRGPKFGFFPNGLCSDLFIEKGPEYWLHREIQCLASPRDIANPWDGIAIGMPEPSAEARIPVLELVQPYSEVLCEEFRAIIREELAAEQRQQGVLARFREPDRETCAFHWTDGRWVMQFSGITAHVPDYKGFAFIRILLLNPGRGFSPWDLLKTVESVQDSDPLLSRQTILDDEAVKVLKAQWMNLQREKRQAEVDNDEARLERLELELESLTTHLTADFNRSGKSRAFSDERARSRKTVRNAIARAMKMLNAVHPALHQHLNLSLRLKRLLLYSPDKPTVWEL